MSGYAAAWGTVYQCGTSTVIPSAYCLLRDDAGYWVDGYTNASGYFVIGRYFPGYGLTLTILKEGFYTQYYGGNTDAYIIYNYCLNRVAPPTPGPWS